MQGGSGANKGGYDLPLSPAVPLTASHVKTRTSKFKRLMNNAPSDYMSFSTFYNRDLVSTLAPRKKDGVR